MAKDARKLTLAPRPVSPNPLAVVPSLYVYIIIFLELQSMILFGFLDVQLLHILLFLPTIIIFSSPMLCIAWADSGKVWLKPHISQCHLCASELGLVLSSVCSTLFRQSAAVLTSNQRAWKQCVLVRRFSCHSLMSWYMMAYAAGINVRQHAQSGTSIAIALLVLAAHSGPYLCIVRGTVLGVVAGFLMHILCGMATCVYKQRLFYIANTFDRDHFNGKWVWTNDICGDLRPYDKAFTVPT